MTNVLPRGSQGRSLVANTAAVFLLSNCTLIHLGGPPRYTDKNTGLVLWGQRAWALWPNSLVGPAWRTTLISGAATVRHPRLQTLCRTMASRP